MSQNIRFIGGNIALMSIASLMMSVAQAADEGEVQQERCYGVAKAGANDCATQVHNCAGLAKKDADPDEWLYVPQGLCKKLDGELRVTKKTKKEAPTSMEDFQPSETLDYEHLIRK